MFVVSIILIIVFNEYFSGIKYHDEWEKAKTFLLIKDTILTLDRMNYIYKISVNPALLENIESKLNSYKGLIWWVRIEGMIKPEITVACNCTPAQKELLSEWFKVLKINDRNVSIRFVYTNLNSINTPSDVLLIIGRKNLTTYRNEIERYLKESRGVVEISDLDHIDETTKELFGIDTCSNVLSIECIPDGSSNISFMTPTNVDSPNYEIWKLFFHFPVTLKAEEGPLSIPVENGTIECESESAFKGYLKIRNESFVYWICNDSKGFRIYLDENKNSLADTIVYPRETFSLDGFKFLFSYAISNTSVAITFKEDYNFTDFLDDNRVYPLDKDARRIVLYRGKYQNSIYPVPAAIVNEKNGFRSVWLANFTREGLENITDAQKAILEASLIYASKKQIMEPVKVKKGYEIPYIDVVKTKNLDMYEVYIFRLGAGYPY